MRRVLFLRHWRNPHVQTLRSNLSSWRRGLICVSEDFLFDYLWGVWRKVKVLCCPERFREDGTFQTGGLTCLGSSMIWMYGPWAETQKNLQVNKVVSGSSQQVDEGVSPVVRGRWQVSGGVLGGFSGNHLHDSGKICFQIWIRQKLHWGFRNQDQDQRPLLRERF